MKEPQSSGALSLNEGILEVEQWDADRYNTNFMDLLEAQPYIMGTLMDATEGLTEAGHSLVLKSVLVLKWSFTKMGWRMTTLSEEKWHQLLEEKVESYEVFQHENGLDHDSVIAASSSPNTLKELLLYVWENGEMDAEGRGNALFLVDCMIEGMEMAVLQDKNTATDA